MSLNKLLLVVAFGLLASLGLSQAERIRFVNYRLYNATAKNEDQLTLLKELEKSSDSIIFMDGVHTIGADVQMIVAPHKVPDLLAILSKAEIKYDLKSKNFQESIDRVEEKVAPIGRASSSYNWLEYNRLEGTYSWMQFLAKKNPKTVKLLKVGRTYEGRPILGLKISKSGTEKPGIFIEAGIHAREWISPAAATYIINQLLTSNERSIKRLGDNYNWYIVPHFNPDGYVYSMTTDRFWRKSRKPYGFLFGADINRNFDFHWNEVSANDFVHSDQYPGPFPFSEIEARSLSKYIASIKGKIQLYLAIHSFSQVLMYPYGFTPTLPDNHKDLQQVLNASLSAISRRHNTKYNGGSIYNTMHYNVSGDSMQWVYGTQGVRMAFCYELRPNQGNMNGFVLPQSQIIPASEELLDSITAMVDEVQKLGYFK